jgi:nucleoside-diphosphate-sugar epimerase
MHGTISVVGAGGFVGSRLIESLLLNGHPDVRAIVRSYRRFAALSRFGPALAVERADAEDPAALVPALRGSATVVNVTTGAPAGIVRSTKALYEACALAGVGRLIHLSSAVVYGDVATPSLDDDAPPVARHWMPYARAKAASEVWLRERMPAAPCEVAVLRPGLVWGVRSPHTLDIVKALRNKTAYLVDNGAGVFNSIYIDNLVACIRACCDHPSNVTGFYNVSDEEYVTWRDFYAALAEHLGYDMARAPNVPSHRLPLSARLVFDWVQSLRPVNALYYWLKSRVPDALQARLKSWLAGDYNYDGIALDYVAAPSVDRELWHLQKVKHKLPSTKFARHFGFTPPVSFEEGTRRTVRWLAFLGYAPANAVAASSQKGLMGDEKG